ncbi:zf-ZPR1-domain-containing protein [Guyanagaster necrorhizus]|uniref:Zf-ZPR1-domain-containing protein n=1 Tax=Guyanagaster necrorhizus TaxID=856835 RepID=A0A9P7W368_9AGAR|nr:zf-ZPR1-domain-containing protein [Guyanagaster necrorhizus MCA 3950]KAG7451343.1 zf-ZPR1-domain-containing protein [Guyanagaster necrorhizus MCA 3950]
MSKANELFPSIGFAADKADLLPEKDHEIDESNADDTDDRPTQEIESLCMKCGEQGVTRMLLTSIPFFREVIVISFRCEHCGATNNEIQSASTIRPEGTIYTARIVSRSDLNRQIVRSESCEIVVPEYELTLPPSTRGQLTTVEGLIRDVIADLSMDQPLRRIQDEDSYTKIQALIDKLKDVIGDEEDKDVHVGKTSQKDHIPLTPFTLKLDDPAGNSFIEFVNNMADPKWNMRTYPRTLKQNVALGLVAPPKENNEGALQAVKGGDEELGGGEAGTDGEIFVFNGPCSSCGHPIDTMMKKVNIPYFKDVIIMSINCDHCGYRDNEVKSGSAISEKGKRITLKVEDREDLSRDILKSETSGITIPEIDLVLQHGTLGGRFTTLEGILNQVYEELSEKVLQAGDSLTVGDRKSFEEFLKGLKEVKNVERPFTLILDDPLANSYVQNLYAPDPDPNMTIELYDRTWEQNEELGLHGMKVENYKEDEEKEERS